MCLWMQPSHFLFGYKYTHARKGHILRDLCKDILKMLSKFVFSDLKIGMSFEQRPYYCNWLNVFQRPSFLSNGRLQRPHSREYLVQNQTSGPLAFCSTKWLHSEKCHIQVNFYLDTIHMPKMKGHIFCHTCWLFRHFTLNIFISIFLGSVFVVADSNP